VRRPSPTPRRRFQARPGRLRQRHPRTRHAEVRPLHTAHPEGSAAKPAWYPFVLLFLLIVGLLMIVLNYVHVLPGGTSNWYLIAASEPSSSA